MSLVSDHFDPAVLGEQLGAANAVTRELMFEVIGKACRRYASLGHSERTAQLTRLIDAEAWADAALTLIELELPLWQVRRIAYDEGEWYCALSRQRELPDWLDKSTEGRHSDLALALLSALVEAQSATAMAARPGVPSVAQAQDWPCAPLVCDNFR